jgi:hypothetical protein
LKVATIETFAIVVEIIEVTLKIVAIKILVVAKAPVVTIV